MGRNNFYAIILLVLSWFLVGCKAAANKDGYRGGLSIATDKGTTNPYESWRNPKTFAESVFMIPDSLATEEQLALKHSIYTMLNTKKHVVMRNGELMLVADKETMKAFGIPPSYLPIIKESLAQTNNSLREWMKEGFISPESLDSIFSSRPIQ